MITKIDMCSVVDIERCVLVWFALKALSTFNFRCQMSDVGVFKINRNGPGVTELEIYVGISNLPAQRLTTRCW